MTSQYYDLTDPKFDLYKIIAIDEKKQPVNIIRVLGIDESGILYIGQADCWRKRLRNMKRAFSPLHKSNDIRWSIEGFMDKFPVDKTFRLRI